VAYRHPACPAVAAGRAFNKEALENWTPQADMSRVDEEVPYRKSKLENGIRVVTLSMPEVRSIAMCVLVDTGIADEPDDKSGLAHLAEHLMFRGTRNRNSLQIARLMDEAGGQMGGFISRDYTCYTATVLDDYRTFALELLGDILLNSLFLAEDVEREKSTILREIESGLDQPDLRADALLKSRVWKGHYLGRSINGSRTDVSHLTRDDVVAFVRSQYRPDRAIIAAAGNVVHHDFVSQVRDAFWCMEGQSQPRRCKRPVFRSGVVIETVPLSQVYFSIGLRAYPYAHPKRYNLHVVNKTLGGGISSRLFRRIREELGLVYDIRSEYQAYRDDGMIVVEGSTPPEYFMQVLDSTLAEIHRALSGPDFIDEEELWKAKMQIKAQHLIAAESSHTQMSRLANQELYFGDHITSQQILAAIDAVEHRSLTKTAADLVSSTRHNWALSVVGPQTDQYDASMIEEMWHKYY
jgi:predicted Zn-dependent peptidase